MCFVSSVRLLFEPGADAEKNGGLPFHVHCPCTSHTGQPWRKRRPHDIARGGEWGEFECRRGNIKSERDSQRPWAGCHCGRFTRVLAPRRRMLSLGAMPLPIGRRGRDKREVDDTENIIKIASTFCCT